MFEKQGHPVTQGKVRQPVPEYYMPAMPPVEFLEKLDARVRLWARQVRARRAAHVSGRLSSGH